MNKQNEALEYVIEALQSYKRGYPDTAADRLVSAFNASEQAVELRLGRMSMRTSPNAIGSPCRLRGDTDAEG